MISIRENFDLIVRNTISFLLIICNWITSILMAANTIITPIEASAPERPDKPPSRSKIIEDVEQKVCKPVEIDTRENSDTLAKCHPQDQSPLFALLPRELRDLIWAFATAPFEDENNRYAANEYYYRPNHSARLRTDTALLLTCRKIWLEANALPMLQAEHSFWYGRGAPDARSKDWMAELTTLNRRNFGHLHLYAQTFRIEKLRSRKGDLRRYFLQTGQKPRDFQPRMFHVTLRHTDWYDWEIEAPLRFDEAWFQAMLDTEDLRSTQTLKLELETLDYKVNQLMPIVERLQRLESREFETHVIDGKPALTKFALHAEPEVYTWSGPPNIDGKSFSPYQGKDKLNYHVITLTWRLRFPEYPHAHIPELRLAPRVGEPEKVLGDSILDRETIDEFPLPPRRLDQSFYIPGRTGRHYRLGYSPFNRNYRERNNVDKMMVDADDVRARDARHAKTTEVIRRRRFRKAMGKVYQEKWAQRWKEEKSLLSFEDRYQDNL